MKADILQKIEKDFAEHHQFAIKQIEVFDAKHKGLLTDRILRAVVFLAKGNSEKLMQVLALAETDYRDVLWQAEYDRNEQRIYDFNQSFYELKLIV